MTNCIDCGAVIDYRSTRCGECATALRRGQPRPRHVNECPDKLAMELEERASAARGAFVDAIIERIKRAGNE